jgi:hypothetical protein
MHPGPASSRFVRTDSPRQGRVGFGGHLFTVSCPLDYRIEMVLVAAGRFRYKETGMRVPAAPESFFETRAVDER